MKKTEQRKRDEAAIEAWEDVVGHDFFEVVDSQNDGYSNLLESFSSAVSAMKHRREGSRIYQKVGKGKYNLVG